MRVLVVDDDKDFRHLAQRALEARGHEVETLPSAFGLVNRVAGVTGPSPQMVVLDCEMPGLSGFSAVELLAKDRRTAQVPILLVSAGDGEQHKTAKAAHPRASFYKKDGRMKVFVEQLELHARQIASADAPAKP